MHVWRPLSQFARQFLTGGVKANLKFQEMPHRNAQTPAEIRSRDSNYVDFMDAAPVLYGERTLHAASCDVHRIIPRLLQRDVIRCGGEEPLPNVSATRHTILERCLIGSNGIAPTLWAFQRNSRHGLI